MRVSLFAIVITLASLSLSAGTAQERQTERIQDRSDVIRAADRGYPWINLDDGRVLEVRFNEDSDRAVRFREQQAEGSVRPLSLVSGDFDEDGVSDIVCGYAASGGGFLILQRGDPGWKDLTPLATGSTEALSEAPFLPEASVIEVNQIPRFVEVGDFNADGHLDLVLADLSAGTLTQLLGDGDGHFIAGWEVLLPGRLTTLAAGDVNRSDGLVDILVGSEGTTGPALLVFEGPDGALSHPPEVIELPSPAVALDVAQLDDHYPFDIAVAMDTEILIVQGRDRKLSHPQSERLAVSPPKVSRYSFAYRILSMVAGDFVSDYDDELALLSDEGRIHILERKEQEYLETRSQPSGWPGPRGTYATLSASKSASNEFPLPRLLRTRISTLPHDDLVLVDSLDQSIHLVLTDSSDLEKPTRNSTRTVTETAVPWPVRLSVLGQPVAVLPMRLNVDALSDLVVLSDGLRPSVSFVTTHGSSSFVVDDAGDDGDGDRTDGKCATGPCQDGVCTGPCTLRAAVDQANSSGGGSITFSLPPGTLIETISRRGLSLTANGITIDGTRGGIPGIIFSGGGGDELTAGITIQASNCMVKGLVLHKWQGGRISRPGRGIIVLEGTNSNNHIEGNYVGTDFEGTKQVDSSFIAPPRPRYLRSHSK